MKVTTYTVWAAGATCAVCSAKLREGDAALAVVNGSRVHHQHAEACTPHADGGALGRELLATLHQEVTRG